ncbi:MAG: F0F1 ATP synthase subunit epsilon [Thermoguttaceae bacterium]|nr:F0F1 ATP synthase subunit epsilon [Thermoguttaceae bacterium]
MPLFDGEYGIARNHTPVIGRIGAGELRVTLESGEKDIWYIEGGFVEVLNNLISVITNRAFPVAELTREKALESLNVAVKKPSDTEDLYSLRENALQAARTQLRLVDRYNKK